MRHEQDRGLGAPRAATVAAGVHDRADQPDPAAYRKEIEEWRAKRNDSLKKDGSWLTLAGLFWGLHDWAHFHAHGPNELAHYARAAFDIQFDFGGSLGPQEIEGVHHRGDFDLGRHQEHSGKKLEYFDQAANERYLPNVVETSAGADRVTLS